MTFGAFGTGVRRRRAQEHLFPQIWLLVASVIAFAGYVAVDLGYAQLMFASDRSRLSLLIVAIFVVASCHAAWHVFATSARLRGAHAMLYSEGEGLAQDQSPAGQYLRDFLVDLHGKPKPGGGDGADGILEIFADRLRSPVETGWFVVDLQIRLGLVGTIIGFILMLASLAQGPMPESDDIRTLLIAMSGGMGTALYTTLAGLVAATLLGIQYMVLGRSTEHLIAALVRIERHRPARAG